MERPIPDETVTQDHETVAALRRRTMVLAAIVLPAVLLTVWLVISQSRAVLHGDLARQSIPALLTAGNRTWTSTESTFSDAELEILETTDYVYRTYSDGRESAVDLCLIFSEDNRKGTHPPDVCLEASGLRIISRGDRMVRAGDLNLMLRELVTTTAGGQYVYFAYFYECGGLYTPSFYRQQLQIIWNGLTRQDASGALIRYSTAMRNEADLDAARERTDVVLQATFSGIRGLGGAR